MTSIGCLCRPALLLLLAAGCQISDPDAMPKALNQAGAIQTEIARGAVVSQQMALARPNAGDNAARGAGEAVGGLMSEDPMAILLAPIFLPVGAVIGAAMTPGDDRWNAIASRSAGRAQTAQAFLAAVNGPEAARAFGSALDRNLAAEGARVGVCVRGAPGSVPCREGASVARLRAEIGFSLLPVTLDSYSGEQTIFAAIKVTLRTAHPETGTAICREYTGGGQIDRIVPATANPAEIRRHLFADTFRKMAAYIAFDILNGHKVAPGQLAWDSPRKRHREKALNQALYGDRISAEAEENATRRRQVVRDNGLLFHRPCS